MTHQVAIHLAQQAVLALDAVAVPGQQFTIDPGADDIVIIPLDEQAGVDGFQDGGHILADGLADDHDFAVRQGDHLGRVRRHRKLRWPQYHFEFHIHWH